MWNWLRNKLKITDNSEELINLNTKLYELIKLQSNCLSDLSVIKDNLSLTEKELIKLEAKIKNIPKEIVVKNVLSI